MKNFLTKIIITGILLSTILTGQEMNTQKNQNSHIETATLGGGCFWCLEPIFQELKGVENVVVGYAGGTVAKPTYEQVCTGNTGHAEVVQITFHPEEIAFEEILQVFFTIHNPTTLNRQGADVGTQYRSVILYHNDDQKNTARDVIEDMDEQEIWGDPIVTEVTPFGTFYKAEEYHQEYYQKNPNAGYCQLVIAPKVAKFRKKFRKKLEE